LPKKNVRNDALYLKNVISRFFIINLLHYELRFDDYLDKRTILEEKIIEIAGPSQTEALSILTEIREKWPVQSSNSVGFLSPSIIDLCSKAASEMLKDLHDYGVLEKIKKQWIK